MKTLGQTGNPVALRPATYNEIAGVVNRVRQTGQINGTAPPSTTGNPCIVTIRNGTAVDLERFDALAIYYPAVLPADDFPEFASRLMLYCDASNGPDDALAVLQEPIKAGKYGKAAVAGLTAVRLLREAGNSDKFAAGQEGEPTLIAAQSGYQIVWEETAPDGDVRLALVLLPKGGGAGEPAKRCRIVSVGNQTLTVNEWDGEDWSGAVTTVCKPFLLRTTNTSRNGLSYAYPNGYTRTATTGANTETQVIVPSYFAGDEIFTTKADSTGVFDVDGKEILAVDLNTEGRAWARQYPA